MNKVDISQYLTDGNYPGNFFEKYAEDKMGKDKSLPRAEKIHAAAKELGLSEGERLIVMHSKNMSNWIRPNGGKSPIENEVTELRQAFAFLYGNAVKASGRS